MTILNLPCFGLFLHLTQESWVQFDEKQHVSFKTAKVFSQLSNTPIDELQNELPDADDPFLAPN